MAYSSLMEATKGAAAMSKITLEHSEVFKTFIASDHDRPGKRRLVHIAEERGWYKDRWGQQTRCNKFLITPRVFGASRDFLEWLGVNHSTMLVRCPDCGSQEDFEKFANEVADTFRQSEVDRVNRWSEEARDREIETNWDKLWDGLE